MGTFIPITTFLLAASLALTGCDGENKIVQIINQNVGGGGGGGGGSSTSDVIRRIIINRRNAPRRRITIINNTEPAHERIYINLMNGDSITGGFDGGNRIYLVPVGGRQYGGEYRYVNGHWQRVVTLPDGRQIIYIINQDRNPQDGDKVIVLGSGPNFLPSSGFPPSGSFYPPSGSGGSGYPPSSGPSLPVQYPSGWPSVSSLSPTQFIPQPPVVAGPTVSTGSNCYDSLSHADCQKYNLLGLCWTDSQSGYMQNYCPKTCGFCGCEDKAGDCSTYVPMGYCKEPSKRYAMLEWCQMSCLECHCIDQADNCHLYKNKCSTDLHVRQRCRVTCDTCFI